jgi:hypothetical protein
MRSPAELQERANAAGAELLLTDTEIAITFLDLADTTRVAENRAGGAKQRRRPAEQS